MRKSISLVALPLIAAGIAMPLVGASAAPRVPRATAGWEHIYLASTAANGTTQAFIATGAFTDRGRTTNGHGVVLTKGTLNVDISHLKAKLVGQSASGCWYKFIQSGPVYVIGGTGAYTGIRGTLNFSETFVAIGVRLRNGKCNMASNAPNAATIQYGTGVGKVRF